MQISKGCIGLSLREQSKNKTPVVKFEPKTIQKWISSLPMANVGEISKSIYSVLSEANRSIISYDQRFKSLLVIEKSANYISQALRKHYLGRSIAINAKQKKIAALAQAMDMEMSLGYKSVIESILGRSSFLLDKKTLIPGMYLAMDYMCKVIIRCYQLYTQPPKGVWLEIHMLYNYARHHNYHQNKINIDAEKTRKLTLENLYMRIVLLAMSNPYQLRQKDIDLVFAALDDLISMIYLEETQVVDNKYVIDLGQDSPPIHHAAIKQAQKDTEVPAKTFLKVNTQNLVDYLDEHLRRVPEDSSQFTRYGNYAFNPIILRHLISSLGKLSHRSFSRMTSQADVQIAVGLAATHHVLTQSILENNTEFFDNELYSDEERSGGPNSSLNQGQTSPEQPETTQPKPATFAARDSGSRPPEDVWNKVNNHAGSPSDEQESLYSISAPNSFTSNNDDVSYETIEASIVNMSPGGYCLRLPTNIPAQTQTGEIVGILREENDSSYWSISVVRWIKRNNQGIAQIGLQLIAPTAIPVRSQVRDSKMNTQAFQRSLLVPEIKGLKQAATLITPPVPYRVQHKVRFVDDERDEIVRLVKLNNNTHSYKQFEFESLSQDSKNNTGQNKPTVEKSTLGQDTDLDDFDNVWDLI
ncbi:MAG: hypothetical protein AAGB12_00840 [Pseudomonadota bacterium]